MRLFKNQVLMHSHVLSFATFIKQGDICAMTEWIKGNIEALGLKMSGRILATVKTVNSVSVDNFWDTEFLVPVDREFKNNSHFVYKPLFKMMNAIKTQHVGSMSDIHERIVLLENYIAEYDLKPITGYYFSFLSSPVDSPKSCIVDIYVGISDNIL